MGSGQRAFATFVKTLGILFTLLLLTTIVTPALAPPNVQTSNGPQPGTYGFDVTVQNRGILDVTPFKLTVRLKSGQTTLAEQTIAMNVPAGETASQRLLLTLTEENIRQLETSQAQIAYDADIRYQISALGYTLMTININQNVSP